MISCPNKSSQEWQELVSKYGEERAYVEYTKAGFDIPTIQQIDSKSYQEEFKVPSKELDDKVKSFLKTIGIDVKTVKTIKDSNGNNLDANAVANLLTKTIDVVEGQAKLDTLPEEASHFLVQILKQNNSPLYDSMVSELPAYDLYKQTLQEYGNVYGGNEAKIKDEAIARIIASQIADKFEQDSKKGRVATWFNRVLNFVKSKLGLIDKNELNDAIIKSNPFSEAAELIYRKNSTNFKLDDYNTGDEKYYQLVTPKNIEDRIRNKYDISLGEDGRYVLMKDEKPITVKNRVSDRITKTNEQDFKSANQKQREELQKTTGVRGHKDLDNIVQREIAVRDGKLVPARQVSTDEETYNTLERYVKQLVSDLPADSRVVTDVPIYDSKTDTGGTPNMLVIHPDGKVDILQWSFTALTKDGKINKGNEKLWNNRLNQYKSILKDSYNITKFGKVRTIPIEVKIKDGFFSGIRTGSQDFNVNQELNPIPVAEELTGNEKLDRVLQTLLVRKNNLEKSRYAQSASPEERAAFNLRKYKNLSEIASAIKNIQLKQDVREFVNIGLSAIDELTNTPINQYSENRLLDLQGTMQFYGKDMLSLIAEQVKDFADTDKVGLNNLVTQAQLYTSNIEDEVARRLLSTTGNPNLFDPQKETGVYTRMFRTISQQSHPIIQSFWKLVQGAKTKTRDSVTDLNERIKSAVDGVKEARGGSSGDLFNFMLKKTINGELNVIPKFDSEFYTKLQDARAKAKEGDSESINFIKKHTTFDYEAYEKAAAINEATAAEIYKNDVDKNEKISDRINNFRSKYSDSNRGLSNPKNFFVKLNETPDNYSKEYKAIIANPKLKDFYDLWMTESAKFQEYIGKDLGNRFVWNVHNDLIDSFRENGWGAFTNMDSILDHLESRAGETLGMIDPNTGKPLYEIPSYYTDVNRVYNEKEGKWEVDSKNQSKDLGKVLSLVGAMAYNHQYMADIEAPSKMLELALANQPEIQTDNNGNPIRNQLTNAIAKAVGSANTLEQFRDYMNYYVYGVKNKTNDYNIKIGDKTYSTLKGIDLLGKWFVGKSLSANPVSIMAHAMRGETNVRIIGAMNKFFSNIEYTKAVGKLVTRDSKFFSLAGHFDLMNGENYAKKAEKLTSASKLAQLITYDNMFIGHTATDYTVRNSILGAMLQSHTYNEETGRIEKMSGEGQKSLYDLTQVKNDKLDFGGISAEQLDAFRNKVSAVGDKVFGMNTRDDINLARLNILGRVLLTFRNWIPGMVDTRYRDMNYNQDLQSWELGRYRTFWGQLVNKQVLPLLVDGIRGFGVFGYGGKFGDVTINRAKELYAKYMEKNPDANMTEQQYVDLHLSNMKANMAEVYITLSMIGAYMAVKKEEGETLQNGSLRKYLAKQLNRSIADIQFFYNPAEFNSILKSPIPLTQAYLEPFHLLKAMYHTGEEAVGISVPKDTKSNELRKAVFQAVPGLNGFESLLSFMQQDYDKTRMTGVDSGSK